jgi:hypothetical protein
MSTGAGFKNCTAAQTSALNGYMADFLTDLKRSKTFTAPVRSEATHKTYTVTLLV